LAEADIATLKVANAVHTLLDSELKKHYKMHNLGPIACILGIEIIRDQANQTMYLSQRKHIKDVLDHFQMANA
jgi:hypothetical protein